MNLLCWALLLTMIIHSSTFAGPVKIAQPFPRNVFELEGNTASVTCIAEGRPDKVQFVRRNLAGIFEKLTNTSRVYTITKTGGGRTTFTLYFETLMVSDDSAERRYECWAHQPEDQDNYWRSSAKHGFSINVISKSSTPSLLPMHSTIYKKNLGDSLKLECTITLSRQIFDIKAISAHWTRNHKIIETVYAENGIFNRTLKPLVFNQISSENGGNYTCLLQTKMRETKPLNFSGGTSVVLVKVLMIRREEDVHVIEGQNATLQCRAEGYPVRVTWSQMNGKLEVPFAQTAKLSTISRYYKDCETCNHKVELGRVTKELRGRYICRATNSLGSGTQVFNLFVDDKVKIIAPFPRNVYIVEGDTATVTCIADGRTDMVQFVRRNELDKFEKLLNTTRVYTTSRVEGARTIFTLHFQKSVLEDDSAAKRYECWAHQPGDVTKHWHKSAKHGVSINVIPQKFVPRLTPEKGKVYRKRLGDSLILVCNMTVSEQRFDVRAEAVHWMKNSKILETVYAKGGQFKTTLQPLYFSNISSEDGGNYSCVMETKLRGIKPLTITSGTQAVYVEIKMRRRKEILHVLKGHNVSLECSAVGYPLRVKWKKVIGGLEIDVEKIPEIARKARFRQECEYCQSKLYLYNVTAVFGGKYLCRANNSLSGGTQYFTLELTDAFTSSSFKARSTTSVFLLLLFLLENI